MLVTALCCCRVAHDGKSLFGIRGNRATPFEIADTTSPPRFVRREIYAMHLKCVDVELSLRRNVLKAD